MAAVDSSPPGVGVPRAGGHGPTGWAGWVLFAGFIMIVQGCFQAIQGLVAIFDEGFYAVTESDLVIDVDYTVWGWVHLALGLLVLLSGFGVLVGNTAARAVGVVLATISAVLNLLFVAAYPVWSVIIIAVDVLVIYALTVHGDELRST